MLSTQLPARELELRLRLAWGDGDPVRWQGGISLSEGTPSDFAPLGIDADESGSIWLENSALRIAARSARRYEGVDVTVRAPETAQLMIRLEPYGATEAAGEEFAIPIAELLEESTTLALDERGNQLVVRRAPGDRLRVACERDHLVFRPGETFSFRVTPHELGVSEDARVELFCELRPARSDERLWSKTQEVRVSAEGMPPADMAIETLLPMAEGAYDIVLLARRRSLQRLGLKQTLAERRIQVVVVDDAPRMRETGQHGGTTLLEEIDPAGSHWWERLANLPLIPGMRRGPLGSGDLKPVSMEGSTFVELATSGTGRDVCWEAYPLPVQNPGAPHAVEVEFPANQPQHLGISIIEPNAAGAVAPVGLDSGIYVGDESQAQPPRLERHRIVFWPRTKTALLLMTNHSRERPAVYGAIRLSEWTGPLPKLAPGTLSGKRLLAAYYDRPLWPENFGASEALDKASGRSLKDWKTFLEGADRLTEYLHHCGRNALVAPAIVDGCALYPSTLLESTPRYDNGVFFATGQDPCRKDVLELLFRVCDREGILFMPMIDFSTPLPALERARREGEDVEGMDCVDAQGRRWLDSEFAFRGQAPYYNPLHPRVQAAMLDVVGELASRYAGHRSFAGIALQLSAHGYAQLAGPEWGRDATTIAAFARDMGPSASRLTTAAPDELASLLARPYQAQWLQWRVERLAEFHGRLRRVVAERNPDLELVLCGAHAFDGPTWSESPRPKLPGGENVEQSWRRSGVAADEYRATPGVVLARPTRHAPLEQLSDQSLNLTLNHALDLDRAVTRLSTTAALFYHVPQTLRVGEFEQQSPFRPTYCWLISQPSPVGTESRRRFVHALATLDPQIMMDGGWLLPMGQEDASREVVEAYRGLPLGRFQTAPGDTQPVVVRTLTNADGAYLYVVNDSPWSATVRLKLQAHPAATASSLATSRGLPSWRRSPSGVEWTLELAPYDLIAARVMPAPCTVTGVTCQVSPEVAATLNGRVASLRTRAASFRQRQPLDVLPNPGFEQAAGMDGSIPGWFVDGPAAAANLETVQPHGGSSDLRLASEAAAVSLTSAAFAPPPIGRLTVRAWMKTEADWRDPPLHVVIEGIAQGEPFERRQAWRRRERQENWVAHEFEFSDLPWERVEALRLRFDLLGAGQVWIDDVALEVPPFSDAEMQELAMIMQLANSHLRAGHVRDCQQLLEGYWPRFIDRQAPLPHNSAVDIARRPPSPGMEAPKPGLMDRLKPFLPRFVR